MRIVQWEAVPLLAAALLAVWCHTARPAPRPEPDLTVHEWGTFSTFSGSDGVNLKFQPYDNDLPDFVHGYLPRNSKAGPLGGKAHIKLRRLRNRPQAGRDRPLERLGRRFLRSRAELDIGGCHRCRPRESGDP